MPATESTRTASRWITRIVPFFLAAAVAYATYVVVARVSVDYFIKAKQDTGAAIAILVLYFIFFSLMIITYLRTLYTANFDPGLVPLGPGAVEHRKNGNEKHANQPNGTDDIEGRAYEAGPNADIDSPGLEEFYTRDVFVAEPDGRPRWCSKCCNWKHDRVHHSSEIDRCVYRMDHYCPWVGGMIGENSFKYFVQFTAYATFFCAVVVGATAPVVRSKGISAEPESLAALIIAAFFGLFASLMTLTSMRYIHQNMTNVDLLSYKTKIYHLAVRVPRETRSDKFRVIIYPRPRPGTTSNKSPREGSSHTVSSQTGDHQEFAGPATSRDDLAMRTFAILETRQGENPWDVGPMRNWISVMGTTPIDWLLPIRPSPCANHENRESLYPMGKLLDQLRMRYGLPTGPPSDESTAMELRNLRDREG
ncbi:DHHC palmitoyltransferase-domain-containing protein [Xylariaceae sp. FL1272]|nr:DHHC palmitoyltransferase-domain-containing protein [Xylariaceae sp. FL1272]